MTCSDRIRQQSQSLGEARTELGRAIFEAFPTGSPVRVLFRGQMVEGSFIGPCDQLNSECAVRVTSRAGVPADVPYPVGDLLEWNPAAASKPAPARKDAPPC